MSLIRDPATITKVGRQMMTAGGDITYTKATLYGQDISHLTKDQLESLTSIGSPLMTVPVGISDKSVNGSATTIVLEATFQNSNLKADLPYTAVGFFAKKGDDEKLVLVGVADPGAYLVATPPDGIATDALDIKAAISIGDAASVTAVVDPAGSVTPATLNGAINKATHDLTAKIDTKADKTTVESELAIKANSTDVDKKLDTKANSSDVYTKKQVDDAFANRDATIATKADKAVVDAEIAKIDFTPYAKTVDVDNEIKTVTDLANSKVDATYSYSKAELDKKLLALSTDTSGKVDANQVADMITGKADKADVDKSIKAVNDLLATKADQATTYSKTDVDKLLSAKDDVTDVDAKIKTVTDLADTKANQDSLNKLSQAVDTKADKATVDAQIAGIDFSKIKFRKQYLDSQGQTQDHTWKATKNTDGTYTIDLYNDDWTASKVHDLLAQLPTKADQSNVNSLVQDAKNTATSRADNLQNQINSKLNYYYVGDGYDVLSSDGKWGILESNNAQNLKNLPAMGNTTWAHMLKLERDGWGVVIVYSQDNTIWQNVKNGDTWTGWSRLANALDVNNLQKNIDGANANANGRLPYSGGNMNLRSTINWTGGGINDRTGNIGGLHWEGGTDRVDLFADQDGNDNLDLVIQLGDDNSNSVVIRNASGAQVARIDAGGNITSPTITTLQNQVNDLINQINYIKQNYLQGKRFPASQEAQAQAWENSNPNGIAMIEK
ncbi:hypothetical protein [Lactobacillus crispatus]|uniref:hypothetical protein n=1 Tax=Lactobacillus crispatus TaxID=47770 RepID=UPI0010401DDC|nr:hypothetical protein [Lactobacillus crispatus]